MLIYATEADLTAWPGIDTAPANSDALLQSASLLVRTATKTAVYQTDSQGYPVDAVISGAFRDAVCAQVATWVELGVNPAGGAAAAAKTATSKKLGSASLSYDAAQVAKHRIRAVRDLCDEARRILAAEGLTNGEPLHG